MEAFDLLLNESRSFWPSDNATDETFSAFASPLPSDTNFSTPSPSFPSFDALNPDTIRVVYARNPPDAFDNCRTFPTLEASGTCPFPGWTLEILSWILANLNLPIVPIVTTSPVGSVNWGTYTNNTWDGVLGYLHNGTADVACLLYQYTATRGRSFSYSYNVYKMKPIYVAKKLRPSVHGTLWNAFAAYSQWVWIALVASFVLQTCYSIFVARVEWHAQLRRKFDPMNVTWGYVRLQLTQPENFSFPSKGGNVVVAVFSLVQAKVMMLLYQAFLLSAILRPGDTNPFKSADDVVKLVASGEYKLITNYIGNWYFEDLANSDAAHFKNLRAAVAKNPVVVADSVKTALDYVELGGYIFPIQEDSLAMQQSKQRCDLVYVSEGLPEKEAYFVFRKGYDPRSFNRAIVKVTEFIVRTYNKYFVQNYKLDSLPKCPSETVQAVQSITLSATFGVFLLVFIGFASGILAFVGEFYVAWQHCQIRNRLRARRAMVADPVHLMALAQLAGRQICTEADRQLRTPTPSELKHRISVAEATFPP